jgi:hypothetical protein
MNIVSLIAIWLSALLIHGVVLLSCLITGFCLCCVVLAKMDNDVRCALAQVEPGEFDSLTNLEFFEEEPDNFADPARFYLAIQTACLVCYLLAAPRFAIPSPYLWETALYILCMFCMLAIILMETAPVVRFFFWRFRPAAT